MTKENSIIIYEDGKKLQHMRKNKNLSMEELSILTNMSLSYLKLVERGILPLTEHSISKITRTCCLESNWLEKTYQNHMYQDYKSDDMKGSLERYQSDKVKLHIVDGDTLRMERNNCGLTRKELANGVGLSVVHIGYIETGKRKLTEDIKNKVTEYMSKVQSEKNRLKQDSNHVFEMRMRELNETCSDEDILQQLRNIKKRKGYTQLIVSSLSGISNSRLSQLERSKVNMSYKVRNKLIEFILREEFIEHEDSYLFETNKYTLDPSGEIGFLDCDMNKKSEMVVLLDLLRKTREHINSNIDTLEKILY